jgi:hypothetical protein
LKASEFAKIRQLAYNTFGLDLRAGTLERVNALITTNTINALDIRTRIPFAKQLKDQALELITIQFS